MIDAVIRWSLQNRLFVLLGAVRSGKTSTGIWSAV